MLRSPVFLWFAVGALLLFDLACSGAVGWTFVNWAHLLLACSCLAAIALFYRCSGRSLSIAHMSNCLLLWPLFSVAATIFSYLAASAGAPLHDQSVVAVEAAIGFDWTSWFATVGRHPHVKLLLFLAYSSFVPQIVLAAAYFCYKGDARRNYELLSNSLVALIITVAVFSFLPTLGPCRLPEAFDGYLPLLNSLRDRTFSTVDMSSLMGIVCFPSYHSVLAVLFTYTYRKSPLFPWMAAFNAIMLIAIPSEGGHYLLDVFAGVAVAALTIAGTAAAEHWQQMAARRPAGIQAA